MLKSELDSVTNLFLMFNISSVKFDVSWPCICKETRIQFIWYQIHGKSWVDQQGKLGFCMGFQDILGANLQLHSSLRGEFSSGSGLEYEVIWTFYINTMNTDYRQYIYLVKHVCNQGLSSNLNQEMLCLYCSLN